ncbi:saccharopine dehydrogenase NADP-binding domain-containing protein [Actinosynnema pretiosum]|uniref:Saccharopine dehydrogenase n=1 Tax=Actinosynnema pretiosum TaxID=42197 RepID=A0A290Z3L2_9PSEU|nr:saccharopine dehydrogenase NADP-binding domain-containing protein [Actinosynnema pretiosum]ATE53559.1 saccharopine dehydrogenase [Actinosynnema pretiosum]
MARVLVLGGYGAVGRHAVAELAGRHEVVVAGRDLARASAAPGATGVRVDLRDADDVRRAVAGADVVLMCAETANAAVARAAAEAGAHYLDVSASAGVLASIEEPTGTTALLSVGLAPGVTNLLARWCVAATGAREVEIGVLLGGGERHGAAAVEWTAAGVAGMGGAWRARFPEPFGERRVRGFPFSDQVTLPTTLPVDRVRTGLCLDSRLATALLPAVRWLGPLASSVRLGGDGFAVVASAGGMTCSFSGNGQSRATGVIAAALVELLPTVPVGRWHVEQVVEPEAFLGALEGYRVAGPSYDGR